MASSPAFCIGNYTLKLHWSVVKSTIQTCFYCSMYGTQLVNRQEWLHKNPLVQAVGFTLQMLHLKISCCMGNAMKGMWLYFICRLRFGIFTCWEIQCGFLLGFLHSDVRVIWAFTFGHYSLRNCEKHHHPLWYDSHCHYGLSVQPWIMFARCYYTGMP